MKMKLFLILFFILTANSFCQIYTLEANCDARAIAMGESFVANTNGLVTADNNPATLVGQKGLSVYYNRTNLNWSDFFGNNYFTLSGISTKTSIGNFSLLYKRFNNEEIENIMVEDKARIVTTAEPYFYTAIISYSNNIFDGLSVGINVKTFGYKLNVTKGQAEEGESNTPVVADFGVLYNMNGFINTDNIKDKLNFGTSLTNYGTDYRTSQSYSLTIPSTEKHLEKLPRMLKLGFAYELNIKNASQEGLFKFVLAGEYDNLLNKYSHYSDAQKDYWKVGMEGTLMDILSLRLGGLANPYTSIYGDKGVLSLKYGLGINFPFELIGINYPVSLSFDYAVMPLTNFETNNKKNLDAFNLSVSYNNQLF